MLPLQTCSKGRKVSDLPTCTRFRIHRLIQTFESTDSYNGIHAPIRTTFRIHQVVQSFAFTNSYKVSDSPTRTVSYLLIRSICRSIDTCMYLKSFWTAFIYFKIGTMSVIGTRINLNDTLPVILLILYSTFLVVSTGIKP